MDTALQQLIRASKIKPCFGYLLKYTQSNDYQFYYSSENTSSLPKLKVIGKKNEFLSLQRDVLSTDIIEKLSNWRDSTKRTFYCLTNITVTATHIPGKPIGANEEKGDVHFYIKQSPAV